MITLTRKDKVASGIFGVLADHDEGYPVGGLTLQTLEHSYNHGGGCWIAKVPEGVYTCKRSMHQLKGMLEPFETFQIMDVPNCTNILFHSGNVNADSEGCCLLGMTRIGNIEILESRVAFKAFMDYFLGIDEFEITIC